MESCQELLDAQAVGNAIYGLQNLCSSDKKEVLQLVSTSAFRVESFQKPLLAQAVSNAIYGLSNIGMLMSCKQAVGSLRQLLPGFCIFVFRIIPFGFQTLHLLSAGLMLFFGRLFIYADATTSSIIPELGALRGTLSAEL